MFDVETVAGRPKWIDFNCAVDLSNLRMFGNKTILNYAGTIGFVAPELTGHKVQPAPAADVFALGKTMAALLCIPGESPWENTRNTPWLGDETIAGLGPHTISGLTTLIQKMTLGNEGARILLSHSSKEVETVESILDGLLRDWAQWDQAGRQMQQQ
jgi:serine/threonine protein kinase